MTVKKSWLSLVLFLGLAAFATCETSSKPVLQGVEKILVQAYPDGTGVRKLTPPPKVGVHPRIFLSPEDLPELRRLATTSPARIKAVEGLRKFLAETLDSPKTPEGRVMAVMATGAMPSEAQFAGANDLDYQLSCAGIDAQISNDAVRGEFLGKVLSAWASYQLRAWVRRPDPAGLHNGWKSGACLAYDMLAPWMSEEQRVPVRRFIAKMMDGINIFTWDWPAHMRMWNWAGLHVYQGWGTLAIEGEEGWNDKLWNQAREISRDYCRYNIHESGALTEDLTYFTLGMQGSGLVMMAMAKRGESEVWATGSHVNKLKVHLANQLHPWGGDFMSHQDGGGNGFYSTWTILKYMYPLDPMIDYAWRQRVGEDYSIYGASNDTTTRRWLMVLFNTEHLTTPVPPQDWKLPLTYFCPQRSYLIARSGWDAKAIKLDFEAKTDYPTVGHNHADANNFTLAALGREWATEFGYHGAAGPLHNNIVIDGRSQSGWPTPGGHWVDLVDRPEATIGVSDARHPYSWGWSNSGYGTENAPPNNLVKWELETLPEVLEFSKTQRESGHGRQTIFEHYGPILRSEWNPVEKAFRTAALVRGKSSYVMILDDIRKDDAIRYYEWSMLMPNETEIIKAGGTWVVLGSKNLPPTKGKKDEKPMPDNRRLLVQVVDVDVLNPKDALAISLQSALLDNDAFKGSRTRQRLVIPARSAEPRFKILLYPHLEGEPLPDILWNDEHTSVEVIFPNQTDRFNFATAEAGRTALTLSRDNALIAVVPAAPNSPKILPATRKFTERLRLGYELPGLDQEIRYTLDGSEPKEDSALFTGSIELTQSATVTAATFARRWAFGAVRRSKSVATKFTRETLRPADGVSSLKSGLNVTLYEGYWNNLPDFAKLKPLATTVIEKIQLPPQTPSKGFGVVFEGELKIPCSGLVTFGLTSDDASRLWIGETLVVDNDGQHIVRTATGEIALAAGVHRLRIAHCDGAIALGTGLGDGSWAFKALWAPSGSTLQEIPAENLGRSSGLNSAEVTTPKVSALQNLRTVKGLERETFHRAGLTASLDFFETTGPALTKDIQDNSGTSDSHPEVLQVLRGWLVVPNSGVVEFSMDRSVLGEVSIGGIVAVRTGLPGYNVSTPIQLDAGLIPYQVKMSKGKGQVQWKAPGQNWQPIGPDDVVRELRPLASLEGRPVSLAGYEIFGATTVTLGPSVEGASLLYSLDGSSPSIPYQQPFQVTSTANLQALYMVGAQVLGAKLVLPMVASSSPTLGLIGHWSAKKLEGSTMLNSVSAADNLSLPEGTELIDDPEQGKALKLSNAGRINLDRTGILVNELTLSFRLKFLGEEGTLMRYGYAHHGLFINVEKGSVVHAGGGGVGKGPTSKGVALNDGHWHQVTATFGGSPFGGITLWVDGQQLHTVRSKAPCVTPELQFFQGISAHLAEVRMYNRVLAPPEIQSLNVVNNPNR